MNDMTKKLNKLVKSRKKGKVVSAQKEYNPYKKNSKSSSSDYSPSSFSS